MIVEYSNITSVEFGRGDIISDVVISSENIGVLILKNAERKHEIGIINEPEKVYNSLQEMVDDSNIIISFSNLKSLESIIGQLNKIKQLMEE